MRLITGFYGVIMGSYGLIMRSYGLIMRSLCINAGKNGDLYMTYVRNPENTSKIDSNEFCPFQR